MPELPEVETIRRQAAQNLVGMTIVDVEYTPSKIAKGDLKQVVGQKIIGVRRFGKLLVIDCSGGLSLCVHLKMTGRLMLQDTDGKPDKHTHIFFTLRAKSRSKRLVFSDMRKFGYIQLVPTDEIVNLPFVKKLGKEMLKDFTLSDFEQMLGKSARAIKVLLLDQQKVAGIGNIYDNEALWMAKIRPQAAANSLTKIERERLFDALEEVLTEGIARGGASDNSYLDLLGQKGQYQDFLKSTAAKESPAHAVGR